MKRVQKKPAIKKVKRQAIPRSRAKNAYDLVSDVIAAIRAEPRRVDMTRYIGDAALVQKVASRRPACGTVGCFAGWVSLLKGGRKKEAAEHHALSLLCHPTIPLNLHTVGWSDAGGIYVFNDGRGDACETTTPGTRAHARAVIARIKHFQTVNADALRGKRV